MRFHLVSRSGAYFLVFLAASCSSSTGASVADGGRGDDAAQRGAYSSSSQDGSDGNGPTYGGTPSSTESSDAALSDGRARHDAGAGAADAETGSDSKDGAIRSHALPRDARGSGDAQAVDAEPTGDARARADSGTHADGAGVGEADARADGATEAALGIPVELGTAGDYVILAETGISSVSPSFITGDLGISPAAATYITGFSLTADSSNVFSTSAQVTGDVYAADYASPTPSNLTAAVGDMETAFTAAASRAADVTGLGAGSIGGMTLPAGVYRWGTGLLLATDVTLEGSATDVWVFQIAGDLTVSNGVQLVLAGGALPENVFWQVSGSATIGTTVQFAGTILCQTNIAMSTSASLTGLLLAQTAVTLDANTVVTSE